MKTPEIKSQVAFTCGTGVVHQAGTQGSSQANVVKPKTGTREAGKSLPVDLGRKVLTSGKYYAKIILLGHWR